MDPLLLTDPPLEWFETPPADWNPLEGDPLVWVGLDGNQQGRFAALVAPKGACLLNGRESEGCFAVPTAVDGYEYSHAGTTVTAGGNLRTANIGGEIDHADRSWRDPGQVRDKYANTASRLAQVRYMEHPEYGVIAVGATSPKATRADALEAMASALSGDWRWISELNGYRFVGSQMTNVPGYRPWQMGREKMSIAASAHIEDERLTIDWIVQASPGVVADAPLPSGGVSVDSGDTHGSCGCQRPSVVAGPLGVTQEAVTEEAPASGATDPMANLEAQYAALESRVAALEAEVAQLIVSESDQVVASAHQLTDREMLVVDAILAEGLTDEQPSDTMDSVSAATKHYPAGSSKGGQFSPGSGSKSRSELQVLGDQHRAQAHTFGDAANPASAGATEFHLEVAHQMNSGHQPDVAINAAEKRSNARARSLPQKDRAPYRVAARSESATVRAKYNAPALPPGVVQGRHGPVYEPQHIKGRFPESGPHRTELLNADHNVTRYSAGAKAGTLTAEETRHYNESVLIVKAHNEGRLSEHLAANPVKGWTPSKYDPKKGPYQPPARSRDYSKSGHLAPGG